MDKKRLQPSPIESDLLGIGSHSNDWDRTAGVGKDPSRGCLAAMAALL